MKEIYHKLFSSVKNRILIIFAGCAVIPSLIFIGVFMHSYSSYILENTVSTQKNILNEINKNINQYLNGYKDTSMNIYYNSAIRLYLNKGNYEEKSSYLPSFLAGIVNSEKYIAGAVMKIEEQYYQAGYDYQDLESYIEKWKDDIVEKKGRVVWFPTEQFACAYGQKPSQFVMARAVNSPTETIGVLLFFISTELFKNCFDNPLFEEHETSFYLLSEECQVVSSNQEEVISQTMEKPLFQEAVALGEGDFVYTEQETGERSIVVCTHSDVSGWTLMTVTTEEEAFQKLHTIRKMAVIIILIYMGFVCLAYWVLSHFVFHPLGGLAKGMKEVSKGKFKRISESQKAEGERQDEISYLIHRYNVMVDEIEKLMSQIREEEKAKNDERMKVLSMQISPHFIYNTLNTIKWMASANRQSNICRMVESLIKIMRSVTYSTNEEIPLKEEVELLECYVYIQKMRFMNFEVEYEIPEELMMAKVNKLVLQPFVENAILHAFRDQEEMGMIRITAREEERLLVLMVEDNGTGFDCQKVMDNQIPEKKDHIGIRNVHERIRLNYGEEFGVRIESGEKRGTLITIRLPLIR